MRTIVKGSEPPSLMAHRKKKYCDYDNYPNKDVLRHALVTQQRGLCCYCMGRIRNDPTTMKIEHWHCQSRYPGEALDYRNLLAACPGGQGKPRHLQHCDTRKSDQDLCWNPANPRHHIETRLRYEADGTIRSDEEEFDRQLNEVLNLNLPFLKNNRKSVLDAVMEENEEFRELVTRLEDAYDMEQSGDEELLRQLIESIDLDGDDGGDGE